MKTKKKVILGMLIVMIMSLGIMNSINNKRETADTNLIWGVGTALATKDVQKVPTNFSVAMSIYGCFVSGVAGAMYGSLFGPGVGSAVGFVVGA
jgi:hypothetical protein